MADILSTQWNEVDTSNTVAAPAGMPTGSPASALYGIIWAIKGPVKRLADRNNPTKTTGGTTTAYTATYDVFTAYTAGETIRLFVNASNTGAATLNINGLGAKNILSNTGTPLTSGQLATGMVISLHYNGTEFRMETPVADMLSASATQTLSNKSLVDASTYIVDDADATKKAQFQANAITTGTTRVLTIPNANGTLALSNSAQTWSGTQTFGSDLVADSDFYAQGAVTINSTAGGSLIDFGRTNGVSPTPTVNFHSSATPAAYNARIVASGGSAVDGSGTLNVDAAGFQHNGNKIWTEGNDGAGSGLDADLLDGFHGSSYVRNDIDQNVAGLINLSRGTATTSQYYLALKPTDFATGKPGLFFLKSATADTWGINLSDGTTNAGTLNINAGNLTWNGNQIADTASSQTLSNKTLAAPTVTGSMTAGQVLITSVISEDLTSTGHGLQIGPTSSGNMVFDTNSIQARSNGTATAIALNGDGGNVYLGSTSGTTYIKGPLSIPDQQSITNSAGESISFDSVNNVLEFKTGGQTKMTVENSKTVVNYYLEVANNVVGTAGGFSAGTNPGATTDQNTGYFFHQAGYGYLSRSGSTCLYLKRIQSTGEIGSFYMDTTKVGNITVSTTSTAYNTTSDRVLKDDQGEFTYEQAQAILDLIEFHNFKWKVTGEDDHGVFAQQLFEVYPRAVNVGGWYISSDDGEIPANENDEGAYYSPWSVDYSRLVSVLGACLKGIAKKQTDLESRLSQLEAAA